MRVLNLRGHLYIKIIVSLFADTRRFHEFPAQDKPPIDEKCPGNSLMHVGEIYEPIQDPKKSYE